MVMRIGNQRTSRAGKEAAGRLRSQFARLGEAGVRTLTREEQCSVLGGLVPYFEEFERKKKIRRAPKKSQILAAFLDSHTKQMQFEDLRAFFQFVCFHAEFEPGQGALKAFVKAIGDMNKAIAQVFGRPLVQLTNDGTIVFNSGDLAEYVSESKFSISGRIISVSETVVQSHGENGIVQCPLHYAGRRAYLIILDEKEGKG